MAEAILMGVIVFMAMFLGRFMPWERLLRRSLSSMEIAFATVFSIAIPFTILAVIHSEWQSTEMILTFWELCAAAVIGSGLSLLIHDLIEARSRAEDAIEREERLIRRIKNDEDDFGT